MNKTLLALLIISFLCSAYLPQKVNAQVITLHVPIIEETEQQHLFFYELLETAIKDIGHTPRLISYRLPQLRIKSYLNKGALSLYWMIESDQRNKDYTAIDVGLTNKLIGKRLLLIKPEDQPFYDNVTDLNSFRALNFEAYLGKEWFDVGIWQANNLAYSEHFSWKKIFKMVAQGSRQRYFPRGINEIIIELKQYTDLAVEKNLVLIYDRDFHFYLSKSGVNAGQKYQKVLDKALKKAQKSGLIERLIEKHWGQDFNILNYENRIKIFLDTPKNNS